MKPSSFELFSPTTLDEALALLDQYQDDAKLLAGGQSLIPAMNLRLAALKYLIDINTVEGLEYIREKDGKLLIGCNTRHHTLETSPLLLEKCPILARAASYIGHLAIRYRGTIGGSLAHAEPAATLPVALLTLDGKLRARSVDGVREFDANEFFYGIFTTALEANEILTEIEIPIPSPDSGYSFLTFSRIHGDFPLLAVGVILETDEDRITKASLTIGGVNPVAERMTEVEEMLIGEKPSVELFGKAAELAKEFMDPETDMHATAEYRTHLVGVYVEEALTQAWQHIKKGGGEDE